MPTPRDPSHMVENKRTGLYVVLAIIAFVFVLALAVRLSGNPPENAANTPNPPVTRTQ